MTALTCLKCRLSALIPEVEQKYLINQRLYILLSHFLFINGLSLPLFMGQWGAERERKGGETKKQDWENLQARQNILDWSALESFGCVLDASVVWNAGSLFGTGPVLYVAKAPLSDNY